MADRPSNNNDPNASLPAVRNTSVGKPVTPKPPASPASERVVGDAAGASGSNAALLDAIRQSSRLTVSQLEKIDKSINATKKEVSKLAKDLEPQVRYHARKFQRWMLFEEEFYKQSVKALLVAKGVSNQFPPGSSIYRKPDATPAGGGRDESQDPSSSGPSVFKDKLKQIGGYAQTPITMLDDLLAKGLGGIYNMLTSKKDRAAKKAAEFEKRYQEELAAEAAKDAQDMEDEGYERLDQLVRDQLASQEAEEEAEEVPEADTGGGGETLPDASTASPTDTLSVATLYVGEMVVAGMSLLEGRQGAGERNVTPEATLLEGSPLSTNLIPFSRPYYDPEEERRAAQRMAPPLTITATAGLPGDDGSPGEPGGPFSPGGIFGGKDDADDARIIEVMDDHADDALDFSEHFFAPIVDFFSNPENTPVAKFIEGLLGSSTGAGAATSSTLKIELPKWLQVAVFALLGMLLPVAIGLGAFLIIAAVVMGLLAAIILPVLASVLPVIGEGIKALVRMFIDFFNDPGAFLSDLAKGIGEAMEHIFGSLIKIVAKAFNEIPILKSLADFLERTLNSLSGIIDEVVGLAKTIISSVSDIVEELGKFVQAVINLGKTIVDGITSVFKTVFDNINAGLNLIGAVVLLIAAVVGTAILTTIIKILATVAWMEAFFKAGGISVWESERKAAGNVADAAYKNTVGAYVELTKSFASDMKNEEGKKAAEAITKAVETQLIGKGGGTYAGGQAGQGGTVNNSSTTVINSNPGFYGIPIYGGGF